MITERYIRVSQEINAIEVTQDNLYSIAKLVNGIIKGTSLPKSKQIVDFFSKEQTCEIRIEIGDFVIKKENGQFQVMNQKEFNENYKKLGEK